ncbi:hypothetical protein G6F57_014247 [Rhizopus arrhizus]|nr:hypothetical protein G6F57_014247 [Rhizopus arrhizus]
MKLRILTLGLASAMLAACGGGKGGAQDSQVLTVYNYSDYIAEDTIPNFEKESGIKRLRRGGADPELLRAPDPGRGVPAAGQEQDPEPGQPRSGGDEAHRHPGPGQRVRRAVHHRPHRHRLQRGHAEAALRRQRRHRQQLGPGVQAGKHQQDEGLRRDHPGHAGGHDPDRAALPGPGPAQRRPGRAAEGGRPAEVDPSVRPEFPLLAVRGLAGQWRHLPGGRLGG